MAGLREPWLGCVLTALMLSTIAEAVRGTGRADGSSGQAAAAAAATAAAFTTADYSEVLSLSWLFYEAQRSGKLPTNNRIPWRGDAHLSDRVVGGWYDAGDTLKISLTTGLALSYLAWSVLEFPDAFQAAGALDPALGSLRWAADYLARCHLRRRRFVGQIGVPAIDHDFWGRPEDDTRPRPALVWNSTSPAADLLGTVSAGLAATSLVFAGQGEAGFAARLLRKAKALYAWGRSSPGLHHFAYPDQLPYACTRYQDKLMYAAAWLHRATGDPTYLQHAQEYWAADPDNPYQNIYVSYDSAYAAAANLLLRAAARGAQVPGAAAYGTWFRQQFLGAWQAADGGWGITKTPRGLAIIGDGAWGSLRSSLGAAFQMLVHAQYAPRKTRRACIAWARGQLNYALGGWGRSYVVGWGDNPPTHCHHRAASCPDRPAPCDWDALNSPAPNPHVVMGALVGGPSAGDAYVDDRKDYQRNEVALDYNAGLVGTLAGLLHSLPPAPA